MRSPSTPVKVGVVAATCGLALAAGTGVASAATATHAVDGDRVTATFTVSPGQALDTCAAVLAPSAQAPVIADRLVSGDLRAVVNTFTNDPNVIALRAGNSPVAIPTALGPSTVSASNVPPNIYALITMCLTDSEPEITPLVLVGDPLAALGTGSAQLSSQDTLEAAVSLIQTALQG